MNKAGWGLGVVMMLWCLAGCPAKSPPTNGAPALVGAASSGSKAEPVVSVTTVRAVQRSVDVTLEATGTVSPLQSVDIRSQMNGAIAQVHLREGQFVKAGQLLFTLDARQAQVSLAKARAQQAKDQALLADVQRQLARSRELLAQQFVSQGAVDAAQAQVQSQQALVAAAQAEIEAALVNLSYSRVTAPIAGRVGAVNVFVGTTVQPGGVVLATITQLDPIAVSFNLPQQHVGALLKLLATGRSAVWAELPQETTTQATAAMPAPRARQGTLQFVDSSVDAASGTVRVKAHFNNARDGLWPGAFVRVKLVIDTLNNVVVVPQASIIQGPRGRFVYTVDAEKKAVARPVEVTQVVGLEAVVSGLSPRELVVVQGQQNLRPGVVTVERPAAAASSAP